MDLVRVCQRHPEGSFGTRKNRTRGLTAIAKEISYLGYELPTARSLKPKHVHALVEHWQQKDLTDETIKNRLTWLRWWAEKVNKAAVIPRTNAELNLTPDNAEPINRAQELNKEKLKKISCPYVSASLHLQAAFGLRREEAIKIIPAQALSDKYIILKASWTKGGKKRSVPITTKQQQMALFIASATAGKGGLIPSDLNYKQQLKVYERQTLEAGFRNTHGLRHQYAQDRFKVLTGFACPLVGGKCWQEMNEKERQLDRQARYVISHELGHHRLSISDTYLGRVMS